MGIPVSELIDRMSYEEIVQWAGYERACQPLGNHRLEELITLVHEQIQLTNWLYAEAKFTDRKGTDGKITMNFLGEEPIKPLIRPGENWQSGPADVLSDRVQYTHADEDDD